MAKLIQTLPWGSTIVELGSCAGRGTWTISRNAPFFSRVYAIDTWDDPTELRGKGHQLEPNKAADMKYFLSHMKDCRNVIPLQGNAHEMDFFKAIDCLIIDCDLGVGKNDLKSIWKKWNPRLASKALIIGANYFPGQRDDEVLFAEQIRQETGNLKNENGIWWSYYSLS